MNTLANFRHWKTKQDDFGIVWATFDKEGSNTNTLDIEVLQELLLLLQTLETGLRPRGLIILSGKESGFIAGADIKQFKGLETPETVFDLIRQGQTVFNHLAHCPFPTVALIKGFCLGGGLELSLACRYRIAIDDPKTKLGLPEVLLGIQPGWGGSVRLPRLIGAPKAMDLILSGRTVSAKTAFKMGIVDAAVPERLGYVAARAFIQNPSLIPFRKNWIKHLENYTNHKIVRPLLGKYFVKKVSERVNRAHYPAPFSIIDQWVNYGVVGEEPFVAEAKSISQLALTDTAKNLVRVFGLQEKLKALGRTFESSVKHIHIIGAGVMGGDIAAWCALKGMRVTLQDSNEQAIAKALGRAFTLFQKQLKDPYRIKAAQDRLMPDIQGAGIARADLILEAIIEKKEAKIALFEQLIKEASKHALFATNTSTIPLDAFQVKDRLIGLHFFNPVAKMPLVEVIASEHTDPTIVQQGLAFVRAIEKYPLLVKSSPGFLVNRILIPYLLESMLLLEEGVPAYAIDQTAKEFGMPMGPIELADAVGLDVCVYAADSLSQYFDCPVPARCRELVKQGHLGKKTGQGFYRYKNGKLIKEKHSEHYRVPDDVLDRLILRLLNESVACLREQIVQDADYLDAGMIFGAGFPPFRGGPMRYIAEQGEALLLQRLNLLAQRYGKRFIADPGWVSL